MLAGLEGLLSSCSGADLFLGDAYSCGSAHRIAAFTWQWWMGQQGLPQKRCTLLGAPGCLGVPSCTPFSTDCCPWIAMPALAALTRCLGSQQGLQGFLPCGISAGRCSTCPLLWLSPGSGWTWSPLCTKGKQGRKSFTS